MARHEHAADLLTHPELVALVRGILRGFMPMQDIGDGLADVQEKIIRRQRFRPDLFWPKDLDEYKRLSVKVTRHYLIDRFRKARRRAQIEGADVVREPDTHAAPRLEPSALYPAEALAELRVYERIVGKAKRGDVLVEIFRRRIVLGENDAEIARHVGMTHQQVRDAVSNVRKEYRRLRAVVVTVGSAGAVACALFVVFWLRGLSSFVQPNTLAAVGHPHPDEVIHEMDALEQAKDIRRSARDACRSFEWSECRDLLDLAAERDPAGDLAPEVQAARDAATKVINDELRTGVAKHGGR
jgi:DNA-directed RNA polymerase specialized sigma24 family protein